MDLFDEKQKRETLEKQFPQDLKNAYNFGIKMLEKAKECNL